MVGLIKRISNLEDVCSSSSGSVIAFGNFDGVHIGHRHVLRFVSEYNDVNGTDLFRKILIFDPHPAEFFGKSSNFLLTNLEQKVDLILEYDLEELLVCRFDATLAKVSPEDFVGFLCKKLCSKVIVVGSRTRFGFRCGGNLDFLKKHESALGYSAVTVSELSCGGLVCSSTEVRMQIAAGNMQNVNSLLGRNYCVIGEVISGNAHGRKLGFPTANIDILQLNCAIPAFGVYKVLVKRILDGSEYSAIANVGNRPTVNCDFNSVILEVHLFNFGDYFGAGEKLYVEFLRFIRPERKFSSLEALREQIEDDVQNCSF